MKTTALLEIIGEPQGSIIIKDRYGNATLHRKGFWSCDPCYLPAELNDAISKAHVARYPWAGRNYKQHNDEWMPFELNGQTLYARSCSDGDGFFGNCVDAGWVVVFPFDLAPQFMRDQVNVKDKVEDLEKIIQENHAGDLANGLTEAQASESDAFERRILGMDEPSNPRYGAAGYSGCYD